MYEGLVKLIVLGLLVAYGFYLRSEFVLVVASSGVILERDEENKYLAWVKKTLPPFVTWRRLKRIEENL